MFWDPEFWGEVFRRILTNVMEWLPNLATVLLLLLAGWLAAHLVQLFVGTVTRRLGIDRLAERIGAGKLFKDFGLEGRLSRLLARLAYWLVLLLFILVISDSMGITIVADTLQGLVIYLPRLLAAIILLLLGGLAAKLIGNGFGLFAAQSGIRGGLALGIAVRYVLLAIVIILALEQLGVDTTLLVYMATAVFGAVALALAVSFGWGSRELARNIMAGFHAREEFVIGQEVTVHGHRGQLIRIGSVKAVLETENGRISLPNRLLIEEEVIVRNPGEGA